MSSNENSAPRRHSVAASPDRVTDPVARAEAEALNGLRQVDLADQLVQSALERGSFKLRISMIQSLHRAALEGLSDFAGNWRPASVGIEGSKHQPVGAHLVAELMEELCDYVNENWAVRSALHLAAYVMWRLNWIHPFNDGNGRTSRATSYLVLSTRLGYRLPGRPTIPEQIVDKREPYFEALEAADAAAQSGNIDVSALESLLERLLAVQLASVLESAGRS